MKRSFATSQLFLKKQFWAWPLIGALVLGGLGLWLRGTIEEVMKARMAEDLKALLSADVEAMRMLFQSQQALALIAVDDPQIRKLSCELASNQGGADSDVLLRAPGLAELRRALRPWMQRYQYDGFSLMNRDGMIVAALNDTLIGMHYPAKDADFIKVGLEGKASVSRPLPAMASLPDLDGTRRVGVPIMFASAPVRDEAGRVVGVLGFRTRPENAFTRILNVARFGRSGETLAFDRSGLLLSQSRFDDDLKRFGLLPDQSHVRSVLNLELRDPGVDLTAGGRPKRRRSEQPLTSMAAEAVREKDGINVDGYRSYRGVPVIGAWTWLPEYGFGVATEMDRAEAYRPLSILRKAFGGLFALLILSAGAVFACTMVLAKVQLRMRQAVLDAKQLGRYMLDEKIGEGGVGVVYRAHHAMLRRPTAVKLLSPEKTNEATISRFEREVQLTSQLNHPNTITIYDYGRTPEGIFYYAMEFLDGINLQSLGDRYGPQPEGRVIQVLSQVCASLVEAHGIGLIHRDIKPANIIINRRGGTCDVVKLVDFGLVKALDTERESALTAAGTITGTPLFLAPESITNPDTIDATCDLYSLAAVGYFLLTGKPVFEGRNINEILYKQVNVMPEAPSRRSARALSPDLENLILRCLAKEPCQRPATAKAMAEELTRCRLASAWTTLDAEAWWNEFESTRFTSAASITPTLTSAQFDERGFETVQWDHR